MASVCGESSQAAQLFWAPCDDRGACDEQLQGEVALQGASAGSSAWHDPDMQIGLSSKSKLTVQNWQIYIPLDLHLSSILPAGCMLTLAAVCRQLTTPTWWCTQLAGQLPVQQQQPRRRQQQLRLRMCSVGCAATRQRTAR